VAVGLGLDLTDHFVAKYRELEEDLGKLQGKELETLRRELEASKGQVRVLEGQLGASKSQVEALTGQVTTLKGELAAAEGRAADARRDCEEARRQKATAEGRLAKSQADLDRLRSTGDGQDAQVRQAQVAELRKEIKELRERLPDDGASKRRSTEEDLIRSLTLERDTYKEDCRVLRKKSLKLESLARKLQSGLEGLKGLLQIDMAPAALIHTFREELDRLTHGL